MKKKALKVISIIVCVIIGLIAILGITIGIMQGVAKKIDDDSTPVDSLSNWMSYIKDDTLITDLVIPGSHDSGTGSMAWVAETQYKSIKEQLECGTRYFDIREGKKNGTLKIIHGPVYGVDFEPIIDDIKTFLENNPSEFLILDFQHFSNDVENEVIAIIEDKLNGKLVSNDTALSEIDFINSLKLSDVRGKAIVYWGVVDSNREKSYVFSRNNDDGTRENSTLQSYYIAKYNKMSSKKYIEEGLPLYINMYKESEGGLFVLQGQLTDGLLIFGPKYREYQNFENMDNYINGLNNSEDLKYINIVMRDFINPSKNAITLKLNISKNLVKAECIDAYNQLIENPEK